MTANRLLSIILASILCISTGFAQNQPMKIAVVNVQEVFDKFKKRDAEEQKLKIKLEKIKQELVALKVQHDDLMKEAGMHNPGSDKRNELDQKIYETRANIELYYRLENIELEESVTEMTSALYEQIRKAIKDYALRNGFTVVLKYEGTRVETNDSNELRLEINSRQVLYFKSSLDITTQIIQILNKG